MPSMHDYLSETVLIAQAGRHAEALERHLWFHEHALRYEPAMYGVRISFALGYWQRLGDVYPPARVAMRRVRDQSRQELLDTGGTFELFHDVVSLNRHLGEQDETLPLFERLANAYPSRADAYWIVAQDYALAAGRHDLVKRYAGDLQAAFRKALARYKRILEFPPDFNPQPPAAVPDAERETFIQACVQLIQTALALAQRDTAREIHRQALEFVDDARLRDALDDDSP